MADKEFHGRVIPVAIEDEIKESYLNYAMSVIVSRALPDARDGLKPVHRRILHSMNEMGLRANQAYKKSGRIVGDVLGKFHPHGDQSIYDALVRLAQPFSMRYPMVNGQGNFGSVDGDPPAAMRYTEAKLHAAAEEMLRDIKKETVDFAPNYDDTMEEPAVLPAAFPYLLTNGASGIAVGMATNIPPHNLAEIGEAVCALVDNPEITDDEICDVVSGPDFPTGGIIYGRKGIREAFKTGRGRVVVRARFTIESTKTGRDRILVNEIPYQVNKAALITRIADLVRDRKLDGISDLRDESDRNGMRIVIELKKGVSPKIILNHLFAHTQLQVNFNVNALALVDGRPETLSLRRMLECFVGHRKEVILRRTRFDLRKAEEREHILIGLKIALDNIDEVIKIIRESKNVERANSALQNRFELSEVQAQAILDMRLQKLTSLETQKIIDELEAVRALIRELRGILESEQKVLDIIKQETRDIAERYGDERQTEIVPDEIESIDIEDLIQKEDMVVVITNSGYIKRIPLSAYRVQGRGGKGSNSASLKDEDFVSQVFIGSTHDYIMFVSTAGKAYWLKVHEIPEASRTARGQHVRGLLQVSGDEELAVAVSLTEFREDRYLFLATRHGVVKKVRSSEFSRAKTRGIAAINLQDGDSVMTAMLTSGGDELFVVTRHGRGLRFAEDSVRPMGRPSRGITGIRLAAGDELAGAVVVNHEEHMVLLTEYGYGKRTAFEAFSPHGRGTRGQIAYSTNDKTGEVVGVLSVKEQDELLAITSQGSAIRTAIETVSVQSRATTGVRVVNIERPDYLVGVGADRK